MSISSLFSVLGFVGHARNVQVLELLAGQFAGKAWALPTSLDINSTWTNGLPMEGLLHNHPVQFAVPPEHEELSILRARGNCRELVRNTASDIVAAGNQLISTVSLCAV